MVANFENAISALSALGYVGWVALGDGISLMNRGRIGAIMSQILILLHLHCN